MLELGKMIAKAPIVSMIMWKPWSETIKQAQNEESSNSNI